MSQEHIDEPIMRFYRDYYAEEIGELAQHYPNERDTLDLSWKDLRTYDEDMANAFLANPDQSTDELEEALAKYDLPIDIDFTPSVRVIDLPESYIYSPIEAVEQNPEGYIGIRGNLHKVTSPLEKITEAAWVCQKCGTMTHVPCVDELQKPYQCEGIQESHKGVFQLNTQQSTFTDYSKIRIQTPPDERGKLQDEYIDGMVEGPLVWDYSEVGLVGRSGEDCVVYGTIDLEQESDNLFTEYVDVDAIEFVDDRDELDPTQYKTDFQAIAEREDAVDAFAESLVPGLYATDEWEVGLELLVAYLFGSPRVSIPEGPTYRGDIHALIISDYGMAKSMVNEAIAEFSPTCIKESVTGMSSDVALLAAAVEDDFAGGGWSLQPGILVQANGGHVILDEIDKADVDLERMNNALEGEQVVDVNKAGQRATFDSKVGLLATGNPEDSRFDRTRPIPDQINIDPSLLSRFDGIVTMEDTTDTEKDTNVASTAGKTYLEAFEVQYDNREDVDQLDREITPELGRNWIHYARENVFPTPTESQIEDIAEWYATEIRSLNGNNEDMPVPATARVVMATIRFSLAFARVHLREQVHDSDVERAKSLTKQLVGQTFSGGVARPHETQGSKMDRLKHAIREDGPIHFDELYDRIDIGYQELETRIQKMKDQGQIMEPKNQTYREV